MRLITQYKVFKNIVDIPNYIKNYITEESKRGDQIFNNKNANESESNDDDYDDNVGDGKRIQRDFKCKIGNHFKKSLRNFIKDKGFGNHYLSDLVIVRSEPYCKRQKMHHDYDVNELRQIKKKDYPYGIIVGVSDHSRFIVSDGKDKSRPKTIHLDKGDVLIFRGDVLHAGAEYYSENVRLHAYIDSTKYKREKNRTYY